MECQIRYSFQIVLAILLPRVRHSVSNCWNNNSKRKKKKKKRKYRSQRHEIFSILQFGWNWPARLTNGTKINIRYSSRIHSAKRSKSNKRFQLSLSQLKKKKKKIVIYKWKVAKNKNNRGTLYPLFLNRLCATRLCCFPVFQTCQGALFRLSYSPSKNAKWRDSACLILRLTLSERMPPYSRHP